MTQLFNDARYNLVVEKDYQAALKTFKKINALSKDGSYNPNLYIVECCIKLGDTLESIKYLREAVRRGNDKDEILGLTESYFQRNEHHPILRDVLNHYQEDRALYLSKLDTQLQTLYAELFAKDQEDRVAATENTILGSNVQEQDSINTLQLIQLINDYGWKKFNLNCKLWFVIVMHGPNEYPDLWKKMDSLMLQGIHEGNLDPYIYALIVDDHRNDHGLPTCYGQLYGMPNAMQEIEDIKNLDKRRKAIGLGTFKLELEITGRTGKHPQGYIEDK